MNEPHPFQFPPVVLSVYPAAPARGVGEETRHEQYVREVLCRRFVLATEQRLLARWRTFPALADDAAIDRHLASVASELLSLKAQFEFLGLDFETAQSSLAAH